MAAKPQGGDRCSQHVDPISLDHLHRRLDKVEARTARLQPRQRAAWIIARDDAEFAIAKAEALENGTYMPGQPIIWWRPISPQDRVACP